MQADGATLVSGEGVRLALAPAGVGSRTIAAAIDAAVQLMALLVLILIDAAVAGGADEASVAALAVTEVVLVVAGYPILMEWTTRGRTLGKLWLGLRVVRDDGGPITFRQALVRGLAGLVLEKPGLLFPLTTVAGVLTISSSEREKRIGDMMAGTIVLNERSSAQRPVPMPEWVPPPLQPWVLSLDLDRLDDALALSTRQFVARAQQMSPTAQFALGEDLRRRVLTVVSPEPPYWTPTPLVLTSVLAERRRRALFRPVQPTPVQPTPVQPTLVPAYAPPAYASPAYAPAAGTSPPSGFAPPS